MPLPSPNLDDRRYADLLEEAQRVAERLQPDWDVRSPSDPGNILLECFAHLTDVMLYRLNRLPEKVNVELLRLIGVGLRPPEAARVSLRFTRDPGSNERIIIPRNTSISADENGPDGKPVIFSTAQEAILEADMVSIDISAYHCRWIAGELLGTSDGRPGQQFRIAQAPIIAPSVDAHDDVLIGVEVGEGDPLGEQARLVTWDQVTYRVWREVPDFADPDAEPHCCMIDRYDGTVRFAQALREIDDDGRFSERVSAIAGTPAAGRRIRAWYRTGGGPSGNVAAGRLTRIDPPLRGVSVTNPHHAQGGRTAEELAHALRRGPHELQAMRRVVTARDYERFTLQIGGIARAKAYAKAELWPQAVPGTVAVHLVPDPTVGVPPDGALPQEVIVQHQAPDVLTAIRTRLDDRRPIGTRVEISWARYKAVAIHARIIASRDHDANTVADDVRRRLYALIRPVPMGDEEAWPFGRTLHASHVYGVIMRSPGVRYIEGQVELHVAEAPDRAIGAIARDIMRAETWYASSHGQLFRSTNDGRGWERLLALPDGERVHRVLAHPLRAGVVLVHTSLTQDGSVRHRLHLGTDYGDVWAADSRLFDFTSEIEDVCWLPVEDDLRVLAATAAGLYDIRPGRSPVKVRISTAPGVPVGFSAIAADRDATGRIVVALAAQSAGGVWLSTTGGEADGFTNIGLAGRVIRCLGIQRRGTARFCWAGFAAIGDTDGDGVARFDLQGPMGTWEAFSERWTGGTCTAFAFNENRVYAGSHHAGVLKLSLNEREPRWQVPIIGCGLPIRADSERLYQITDLAIDAVRDRLMVGTEQGIYEPVDGSNVYRSCGSRVFTDQVTIPETWLFCSDRHVITVVNDHGP